VPLTLRNCTLLIFFLSISFCATLKSQRAEESYAQVLKEYNEADKVYWAGLAISGAKNYTEEKEEALNKKALILFSNLAKKLTGGHFDSLSYFTLYKKGELLHYFDSTDQALDSYKQALSKYNKSFIIDSFQFKPLLYAGIIYYGKNIFDSALYYFKEAEKLQLKYNNKIGETERLYNTLGVMYYETGNYKQAKNYFEKAAYVLPQTHPYYKELLVNYKSNLAAVLTKSELYKEAQTIYDQLLKLGISTNEIYHNKGTIELATHQPEKAIFYFKKLRYTNSNQIKLLNDLGTAYFNWKKKDSAKACFTKAIEENRTFFGAKPNVPHGLTLKLSGDLLLSENKAADALHYYQLALHNFYPSFNDTNFTANPTIFSGVFSYLNLFNALTAKADALQQLYQQGKEKDYGINELATYEAAYLLIDYVAKSYNSDEAKIFLSKIKYLVHAKPIKIALQLFEQTNDQKYLEMAYVFDQKNKAATLVYNQYKTQTEITVNTALLKKEEYLKNVITKLSIKGALALNETSTLELNSKIRDAEIELYKVQEKIKASENPVTNTENVPSVKELQQNLLDTKTAILSYHLSDTNLVIFCITKKGLHYKAQKLNQQFNKELTRYLQQIQLVNYFETPSDSFPFGDLLVPTELVQNADRLILIPDGLLCYLPFEALKKEDDFLVNKYSITYQYSTSLLQKENFDFTNSSLLGMAPFTTSSFSDSSSFTFSTLPNSFSEFNNTKGAFYRDNQASKQKFIQQYPDFNILHIATHAMVNDTLPNLSFIAFTPGKEKSKQDYLLYAQEIYNLNLRNNKLVILSACETGSGNFIYGEGIMSLSRAFASAGCSKVITSLWKADDETTAYLVNKFHFYLKTGLSIDHALQKAKQDYLQDKKINPRKKHPSFWAHLIFIGKYKPATVTPWYLYFLGVVVAIGILFYVLKKPVLPGFKAYK
jgi:CHAT domain-containing protein/tetratricopeptide (TPR) repeat protein